MCGSQAERGVSETENAMQAPNEKVVGRPKLAGAAGLAALAVGCAATIAIMCTVRQFLSDWEFWGITLTTLGFVNWSARKVEEFIRDRDTAVEAPSRPGAGACLQGSSSRILTGTGGGLRHGGDAMRDDPLADLGHRPAPVLHRPRGPVAQQDRAAVS